MSSRHHDTVPMWSWLFPGLAALLLATQFGGVVSADATPAQLAAAVLLFGAVFAAVHHAEVLALRLGEPFGSILLAVAVTVIEVALIVSILLSGKAGTEAVARDTVFSAVMIVLNGVVGLCLVLGASQHHEQSFQLRGASAALGVLAPLAVLALVLPDYTVRAAGPYYSPVQLVFVAILSLVLYATFVFVQTIRHRDYFLGAAVDELAPLPGEGGRPSGRVSAASAMLLLVALATVVLLAKLLSHPLEDAVAFANLPRTCVGIVIALLVTAAGGACIGARRYREPLAEQPQPGPWFGDREHRVDHPSGGRRIAAHRPPADAWPRQREQHPAPAYPFYHRLNARHRHDHRAAGRGAPSDLRPLPAALRGALTSRYLTQGGISEGKMAPINLKGLLIGMGSD
jgi:Ca2+:H+ antiporter